ncbi:MAG: hypothetical protein EBU46_13920 [Nitrosomonadaceae bacterium]|nr:hypothetical protein [Nitrosomonadaceae bacterium]
MPFDLNQQIKEFLANPENVEGLKRVGIGAGVGAAGLGLADAFSNGDEESQGRSGKTKSVLKSMLLGGLLGGAGGAGVHALKHGLRPSTKAPNGEDWFKGAIPKGYSQIRAAMGADAPEDRWRAERRGAWGGAAGGGALELRDWLKLRGDKGPLSALKASKDGTEVAALKNALTGRGAVPPALEEQVRQFVKQHGIADSDVATAFGNRGQDVSTLDNMLAGLKNTKDAVKGSFNRVTSSQNWIPIPNSNNPNNINPANAGRGPAPGIGTAATGNNLLRKLFGHFGPSMKENRDNFANRTYAQSLGVPVSGMAKPLQNAIDTTFATQQVPNDTMNAAAQWGKSPMARVMAQERGLFASPWARVGGRVGGGALLGAGLNRAADWTAQHTFDRLLMNPSARQFVQ